MSCLVSFINSFIQQIFIEVYCVWGSLLGRDGQLVWASYLKNLSGGDLLHTHVTWTSHGVVLMFHCSTGYLRTFFRAFIFMLLNLFCPSCLFFSIFLLGWALFLFDLLSHIWMPLCSGKFCCNKTCKVYWCSTFSIGKLQADQIVLNWSIFNVIEELTLYRNLLSTNPLVNRRILL